MKKYILFVIVVLVTFPVEALRKKNRTGSRIGVRDDTGEIHNDRRSARNLIVDITHPPLAISASEPGPSPMNKIPKQPSSNPASNRAFPNTSKETKAVPSQPINSGVSFNQQISSASLNAKATTSGMFIIAKSGRYFLSTDILAAPCTSDIAIIYINASDTLLDLGGKSITLSSTGNITSCRAAIEIASGVRNITIMNGTINGQVTHSITAACTTTTSSLRFNRGIMNPTTGTIVNTNVLFDGLNIINCTTAAIDLRYVNDLSISNVSTYGSTDATIPSTKGLALANCNRGTITNSSFGGTYSAATGQGACYGIYATTCSNFALDNVTTSNNNIASVNTAERSGTYGIYLYQCTAFYCLNVNAGGNKHFGKNSNSSTGNECCGFFLNNTTNSVFDECLANNNIGGYQYGSNYTCSTYGFKLTSSSDGNSFTNCEASGNAGAADAAGFFIGQSGSNIFDSCLSLNNTSSKTTFGSRLSFGFTTTFGGNNFFNKCKATGNKINARASNKAHGFAMRSEQASIIRSCDACFNGPGGITVAGEGYGIACLGHCNRCHIVSNILISNLGATAQFGFKDFSANFICYLQNNLAFAHGACNPSGTNNTELSVNTNMNYFFRFVTAGTAYVMNQIIIETSIRNPDGMSATQNNKEWTNASIIDS